MTLPCIMNRCSTGNIRKETWEVEKHGQLTFREHKRCMHCMLSQHESSARGPSLCWTLTSFLPRLSVTPVVASVLIFFFRFSLFKNFSSSLDISGGLVLKFHTCQGLTFQLEHVWKVWVRWKKVLKAGRLRPGMWCLSKSLMKHRAQFLLPTGKRPTGMVMRFWSSSPCIGMAYFLKWIQYFWNKTAKSLSQSSGLA